MSVEQSGPAGYDYQYWVTLYLALFLLREQSISVCVEDTEDAAFRFRRDSQEICLYLQVKKHQAAVGLPELCNWLGHFGARQDQEFLLSRLEDAHTFAVFVTDGRCRDDCLDFLREKDFAAMRTDPLHRETEQKVRVALGEHAPSSVGLEKRRQDTISVFLERKTHSDLTELLKKVSLAERCKQEALQEKIHRLLNGKFSIREEEADATAIRLLECVKNGRTDHQNIVPELQAILRQKEHNWLPAGVEYLPVPAQEDYEQLLETQHVLLLTGVPFCGKTILAKYLAQNYARAGYQVLHTDKMEEAIHFFSNYSMDRRFLLLEDPFRDPPAHGSCFSELMKLAISDTGMNRKLVVTTRTDQLLQAVQQERLEDCALGSHAWQVLDLKSMEFAREFWQRQFGDTSESLSLFQQIHLQMVQERQGEFFEIGEISFLKCRYSTVEALQQLSVEELIKKGRVGVSDVVREVRAQRAAHSWAFFTLGLCCNTLRPAAIEDLAFVLSDSSEEPAICRDEQQRGISIGCNSPSVPPFPRYEQQYQLESELAQAMEDFHRRGWIRMESNGEENLVLFSHPVFFCAAREVVCQQLSSGFSEKRPADMVRRALSTARKSCSLCALEVLQYELREGKRPVQRSLAPVVDSLRTVFPAVKDAMLTLCEAHIKELESDQKQALLEAIQDHWMDAQLFWNGDEPYLSYGIVEREWRSGWRHRVSASPEDPALTLQLRYELLQRGDALSSEFLEQSLQCDEKVLRARALFLLFRTYGPGRDITGYLHQAQSGAELVSLLQGALQVWDLYQPEVKTQLIQAILAHMETPSLIFCSLSLLTRFGREEVKDGVPWGRYDEDMRREIWTVWCVLMTQSLQVYATYYEDFDDVHLWENLQTSREYLRDTPWLAKLFQAWSHWLSKASRVSSYGEGLMEEILRELRPEDQERQALVAELLSEKRTGLCSAHACCLVEGWELATEWEREQLCALLCSERPDLPWLRAMALTRAVVPAALQIRTVGQVFSDKPPSEAVKILTEADLLEPCFQVYFFMQGSRAAYWNDYLKEILLGDVHNAGFRTGLKAFLDRVYASWRSFPGWEDTWQKLLQNSASHEAAGTVLLQVTVSQNDCNAKVWRMYLNACTEAERRSMGRQIARNIEAVERYQDTVLDLFDGQVFDRYVLPELPEDQKLLSCVSVMQERRAGSAAELLEQLRETPYRTNLTEYLLKKTVSELGILTQELTNQMEEIRHRYFRKAEEQERLLTQEPPREHWIG